MSNKESLKLWLPVLLSILSFAAGYYLIKIEILKDVYFEFSIFISILAPLTYIFLSWRILTHNWEWLLMFVVLAAQSQTSMFTAFLISDSTGDDNILGGNSTEIIWLISSISLVLGSFHYIAENSQFFDRKKERKL